MGSQIATISIYILYVQLGMNVLFNDTYVICLIYDS